MTKCARTEEDTTNEKRKFWSWYFLKNVILYPVLLNLFLAGTDAGKNQFIKVFTAEFKWKAFGCDLASASAIQIIRAVVVLLFSQSSATEYYATAFVKWVEERLENPQRKYEVTNTIVRVCFFIPNLKFLTAKDRIVSRP